MMETGKESNNVQLFEHKQIVLTEERTVAAYRYKKIIEQILDYIITFCNENKPSGMNYYKYKLETIPIFTYNFEIPKELTELFKEFDNLTIKTVIHKLNTSNELSLIPIQGNSFYNVDNKIVSNGKLVNPTINIESFLNSQNDTSKLMSDIYHELNHLFEDYLRLKGSGNLFGLQQHDERRIIRYGIGLITNAETESDFMVGSIIYRLWDNSELSAGATSVYATLKSLNSTRENFSKDILKTQAHKEYSTLKNNIETLKHYNSKYRWRLYQSMISPKKVGVETVDNFKKYFLRRSETLLKQYFIKMCKSASLWYDESDKIQRKRSHKKF